MLFRDSDTGPEVLLVERPSHVSFGGSWVFPGGGVESADCDEYFDGLSQACIETAASQRLGIDSNALCWLIAAVREVFEETGIVLSENKLSAAVEPESNSNQPALFLDQCRESNWIPSVGRLHYLSFWIAPEWVSPRYATRFFATALPEGQVCRPDGIECLNHKWLKPEEAIEQSSELQLPRPTIENLRSVCGHRKVKELLEALASRPVPLVPVLWPHKVDGELLLDAKPEQLRNLKIMPPGDPS